MKEYIVFKRQRELGEILSDTFKFIRLEYKPLFSALIKNAGIPFLVLLAAAGFYAATATDFADITGGIFRSGNVIMGVLFLMVALLFYYGFLYGTVLNYIKSYIENEGNVNQEQISQAVRANLGGLIGLGVLSAVILIAGFVACILPGIYLSVPLSLVFAIMIFRGRGISDSISESFVLIKGEWWVTFATIIVVSLVVYLIGMVFQVPVIIYTIIKGLTSSSEISNGDFSSMFDWVYITLNVIASAVSYILYAVVAIASAFIYYNLNETKNQTGTLERIDSIGDNI
tara:strand:- start:87676 stop:88533 length:858 start_codon:yes stop_codon:yes gene_type:complete